MPRVLIPLAEGCEELEAVTLIDLLRRAEIEVVTAGLKLGPITASRGTVLIPDHLLDAVLEEEFDMVLLPGGLPGADHLEQDARVRTLIQRQAERGAYNAAICAAPKVLAAAGVLEGKRATAYPGSLDSAAHPGIKLTTVPVQIDGKVMTSRGPGTAMDFALSIIETLIDKETRDAVESKLLRPDAA